MIIEHFEGKNECNNLKEIKDVLIRRTSKGVNEFTIHWEEEVPYMVMLVNNDYAYLHYYKEEDDPGFRSIGGKMGLDKKGNTVFYTNTDKEEVSVENLCIVSFATAVEAVMQFFSTKDMPAGVEWDEL